MSNVEKFVNVGLKSSPTKKSGGSGKSQWLSIRDGQTVMVVFQEEIDKIPTFMQHSYWSAKGQVAPAHVCIKTDDGTGETCPGCEQGNQAKFRGLAPVLVQNDQGEWEPRIYGFTKRVNDTIVDVAGMIESTGSEFVGSVLGIKRSGTQFETRYNVMSAGRSIDLLTQPDPIDVYEKIGPFTRKEIMDKHNSVRPEGGTSVTPDSSTASSLKAQIDKL